MEECMLDTSLVESYMAQFVVAGGGLQFTEMSWSSAKTALTVRWSLEQEESRCLRSIRSQYSVPSRFLVWTLWSSRSQRREIATSLFFKTF